MKVLISIIISLSLLCEHGIAQLKPNQKPVISNMINYIQNNYKPDNQSIPSNNQANGPSKTKPENLFSNFDSRIVGILSSLVGSDLTQQQIASAAKDISIWSSYFDQITDWSTVDCKLGLQYYQYLEDELVNNKNQTWITLKQVLSTIVCKNDCNFNRLFTNINFSNNSANISKAIISLLSPDIVNQCRNTIGKYLPQVQLASDVFNNLNNIGLIQPSKLSSFSQNDTLEIAKKLTESKKTIDKNMAQNLGKNILKTQNLQNVAAIASSIPLECFNSTPPSDLVNLLGSMDIDNMDSNRKAFIGSKIAKSNDSALIKNMLLNATDPAIINSIPYGLIKTLGINISNIPASNLPPSYLKFYCRTLLDNNNNTLVNFTSLDMLSKLLSGIKKSDLAKISDSLKASTLINILNSSLTYNVDLTNSQRSAMLKSLLNSLQAIYGSNSSYLASLTISQLQTLYPLFLEANATVLAAFSKLASFATVISKVAAINSAECCKYSRSGRALFASYAAPYLVSYTNLELSDLYKLGPCIVSVLPIEYLKNISATTFISYFTTIGSAFQPDSNQTIVIKSKISSVMSNYSSQETLVFSVLNDLALYYPSLNNLTTFSTNGASLMAIIKSARDPTDPSIQECRLGLTNSNSVTSDITSLGKSFVSAYFSSSISGRRKRSESAITCNDLNNLSGALNSLTTIQLNTIIPSEFISCQTLLGSSSNDWSSDQLITLATLAKSIYINVSSINDNNIASLNSIMIGFSSNDLSSLVFTSITPINTLGTLSDWTSEQLTNLAIPLTKYINQYNNGLINSNFITSAGNLICGLNVSQINSISSSDLSLSISVLSIISSKCQNIASIYNAFKLIYGSNIYNSPSTITELGSVMAGISLIDLSLVPADSISSISSLALTNMPASTVNSLSSTQLSELTSSQLSTLINSPNYSSYSSIIQANLASLSVTGSTNLFSSASLLVINSKIFLLSLFSGIFIF